MWSILQRKTAHGGRTGLHHSAAGTAIAQIRNDDAQGRPQLVFSEFTPEHGDMADTVTMRRTPNRGWPAVNVLPPETYAMLLVEAPDVAQEELKAAVRWRIKDLLDFHVDDAVIEVFGMPRQGRGGPTRMMYAIAAREQEVRKRIENAQDAGLNLQCIDILELSLRNVAVRLDEGGTGVGLLYLHDEGGIFILVRDGVLYLARHFDTGLNTLRDSIGRAGLIDGLALEIQRSLDYYESHYEQNSIQRLYAWGLESADLLQLDGTLGSHVHPLELESLLDMKEAPGAETRAHLLPAIGGALRTEEAA